MPIGLRWTIILAALGVAGGCGGHHASPPVPVTPNPVPTLTSLSPTSATAGAAGFTLTLTGTNFVSSSAVNWNGSARSTAFVSTSQLTASINGADVAAAGTASVTVVNPAPGGGTSSAVSFTIAAANPVPALSALAPSSATAGAAAFTLTVTGSGFVAASLVDWNGSPRTTTFVSATQLSAAISAADIAATGTASITVVNPVPGGGTSSAVSFSISMPNPVPTLSSISPSAAPAGAAAFTLTVNGAGFIAASTVNWNGSARTTTFGSATQLTAAITAADIAAAGSVPVTVVNPAPGGGASSPVSFTVTPVVATAGFVTVVSVNDSGTNGNSYSTFPSIGADGRFVTFQSGATNLVSTPIQLEQIFLRDTCVGATGCTPSTRLVSVDSAGTASANTASGAVMAAVSTDGNSVVYASTATNIDALSVPPEQAYWRTTCTAQSSCTPSTQFSIVNVDGITPPAFGGFAAAIDTTGRFILSAAISADLVGSQFKPIGVFDDNIIELYERDTCQTSAGPISGCTAQNIGITVTAGTGFSDSATSVDYMNGFSLSKGGRFVAFGSTATDLLGTPIVLSPGIEQVYLRDTCSVLNNPVAGCIPQTVLISQNNSAAAGIFASYAPSVSDDGRFVAFRTESALAPPATSGNANVFLRDTCLSFTAAPVAGCTPTTYLISVNAAGTGDGGGSVSQSQSISADGRLVAFTSLSVSLTNPASPGGGLYLRDTCVASSGPIAGCTPHTVALSYDGAGNFLIAQGLFALSSDGHYLAFAVSSGGSGLLDNQVVLVSTGF
ncbi:MAG TPA: hypothetical protein VK743_09165 [Steroidobacteraceae bacterium]|nr:hypothetical protein [Steroidobacteraceae bacterium]